VAVFRRGGLASFELKAGPRGLPLQRHILADAKIVRFINGNGLDVRRQNLREMSMREVAKERYAHRKKEREEAKAA
jgi:hypothetical protein